MASLNTAGVIVIRFLARTVFSFTSVLATRRDGNTDERPIRSGVLLKGGNLQCLK